MIQIFGVIGDPISHSLSPKMHNHIFKKFKIPYFYFPFHVTPRTLPFFMRKLRGGFLKGFNVTVPHKEKILRWLDVLSPEARLIGAVNTILYKGKKIYGHNTDWQGFVQTLKEEHFFLPHKRVTLLGSGGAARAILYSCCRERAKQVTLFNFRNSPRIRRMRALLRTLSSRFPNTKIVLIIGELPRLKNALGVTDLLVNATTVGLCGTRFHGLPMADLPKKAHVFDSVYKPQNTPFLQAAKKRGLKTHSGLGMLIHQGLLSLKLWISL